jgi:HPt (histidine-containing phosphotransfer) domain-containing protein
MAPRKDKVAVTTFGAYEIITPENKLRKAVSNTPFRPGEEDPIARAEKALVELSTNFATWMKSECERLDKARRGVTADGFSKASKEALFHAAHDIKGQAATFGYPLVAAAADSLCRLIEHTPDPSRIPIELVDQHVDAVRAIYREYARSDAKDLAATLNSRLREVTDEFLVHENRGRPEVLEQIMSPSIVME